MTTHAHFTALLSRLQYKDWTFKLGGDTGGWWLQAVFTAPNGPQRGRKWLLSTFMTDSEVVQTAFTAVLMAEEHECREQFLLDGVAVLGPHMDLFALIDQGVPLSQRV